ncbi:MAG: hypothetical protein HOB40_05325 [Candidatus Marinimicrobia bacterium]|jgi:hypothetical protein|nr:hypothetical protein [Candidatus Neomarinimicrobiota bacterium]MBT3501090.1 hypothetical protein [Candidatus Neomarinimicrobiota bacterium]MBT3838955.1 hypothetical protein [Candidatus Neomarinimicrobiota bacterium]MBT4000219.1 hypothetical protein [Candidatus Neomarinimicrobiota bacterium]MBT4282020.1 hypothetical protein [Candidatus Neomarinimicrobiota bacterium]
MVGLVISDTFLLCGTWDTSEQNSTLKNIVKVPFTGTVSSNIYDESELNSILGSALRKARETLPIDGQDVIVGLPDDFVNHSVIESEFDLSKSDSLDYIQWIQSKKGKLDSQLISIFGQVYLPDESNIHICTISKVLIRTIKLSIVELGGNPSWMGPVSSLYLDGSGMSEAAIIQRNGNRYSFLKVQNNRFDMGIIAFSGGVAKIISTTDDKEEITLAALGLEDSYLDDIPVFCPQKLGRQAISAWETSDFRISIPFDGIEINNQSVDDIPEYEANILTQLMISTSVNNSFNFFDDSGITDFFFTSVIPPKVIDVDNSERLLIEKPKEKNKTDSQQKSTPFVLALILLVMLFIGINYFKLQKELNNSFFGINKNYSVKLSESKIDELIVKNSNKPSYDLLLQSKSISSALLSILTQTDLNRYNSLTITKSFLSLEYLSGTNPNIENILGVEPTSFSVEAIGRDSTIFLWYYSFDLPNISGDISSGELSKLDLMIQLDTALTDYSLKYFEQVFTENQIYGPLLIWVKNKADILQASAIISNVGDNILLRKFVLFNEADHPSPRAGFYVSILED